MIRGWCYFIDHNRGAGSIKMGGIGEMRWFNKNVGIRDHRQITFEFLNRICLLRGEGIKANLSRISEPRTKIFYRPVIFTKCFILLLLRSESCTVLLILTRSVIGIANLPKFFATCFVHEICLKPLSAQKMFKAFNYSYINAAQCKV